MYLSSRAAARASAATLLAAALLATGPARAELSARAAFGGMRPTLVPRVPHFPYSGIAPTIVGRGRAGYPPSGIHPTIVRRGRRVRGGYGGYGYGGYGGDGLGSESDFTTYPFLGDAPPGPGPQGELPPPPFSIPAPVACPQIIEIGRGLEHKAKSRVIYGTSPCGR